MVAGVPSSCCLNPGWAGVSNTAINDGTHRDSKASISSLARSRAPPPHALRGTGSTRGRRQFTLRTPTEEFPGHGAFSPLRWCILAVENDGSDQGFFEGKPVVQTLHPIKDALGVDCCA